MSPALHAVGRSLCSSAVVQISDDAQLAATELDAALTVQLVPAAKRCREGSETWGETEGDTQMPTVAEASQNEKVFNGNALPLTVDNLQRHTRIQEKHYRQQVLHQLQCQQVHAHRSRLHRAHANHRTPAAGKDPIAAAVDPAQSRTSAAFHYRSRQPPEKSESEQRMRAKDPRV